MSYLSSEEKEYLLENTDSSISKLEIIKYEVNTILKIIRQNIEEERVFPSTIECIKFNPSFKWEVKDILEKKLNNEGFDLKIIQSINRFGCCQDNLYDITISIAEPKERNYYD